MEPVIKRLVTSNVTAVQRIVDGQRHRARTSQKLVRNNRRRHQLRRNSKKGRHVDSFC